MTGKGGTPANSEDPDEMLYNVAFHRSGNTIKVSKALDSEQDQHFVLSDLATNCLQRLSSGSVDGDKSHQGACKKPGTFNKIQDAVIPSRARLTLPPSLNLKCIKEDGKISYGVFPKRTIPQRSQFGPLDAPVIGKSRKDPKPKKKVTVWKKKHAMQKSLQQSAMSQSIESVEQGLSPDVQTSPIIATAQPVSSIQKHQSAGPLSAPSLGNTLGAGDLPITLSQNILTLPSGMTHQDLTENLQNLQPGLQQMTSPTPGQHQLPLHSSPILANNNIGQLQLQAGLPDFTAINFQSPQGNMVHVMSDNLQTLQEQFQNYGQIDLTAHQSAAGLSGFVPPSSVDSLSASLPTMHQNQSGSSSGHGLPPTDSESQSPEDSGVGDTSHNNISDSMLADYTSDTDVDESYEQDFSFEIKVVTEDGYMETYDLNDEDHSNWMIFVRPATCIAEQNLIAYQEDGHIFYVSLKPIPPNTELKVWYSKDYAKAIGKALLQEPEPDEKDITLECMVCKASFETLADLENHPCMKVKGRRKGRPRKYVKPTKTWRAKLEKTRLKESLQVRRETVNVGPIRQRGRPRKHPLTIKREKGNEAGKADSMKIDVVKIDAVKAEAMKVEAERHELGNLGDDSFDDDEPTYIIAFENENESEAASAEAEKAELAKKKRGPKKQKEPMVCPHCGAKFAAEANYHLHVFEHTGKKPFVCDVIGCERGFMSKFKLDRHSLIHSCPRHHKCPYCDKSFNRKDHLKNHLITHDPNKKIWKCGICAKEYSYSFSFKIHMAFHAAESGVTLECAICKKTFPDKDGLLFHLKVHTGARAAKNASEKIHQCHECGKKFYTRKDVKRHMITHTKKKDFLCQFCPQRFGRKDHLTRHLRTSHTGDNQHVRIRKTNPDGTPKRRERQALYEKLEPTMVPLPLSLAALPDEDQQLLAGTSGVVSGSQAALLQNLQYAVSGQQGGTREIQIPTALFEAAAVAANAQQPQPVAASSISSIQPPPGMPSTHTSAQPHYTINEKGYIMNANPTDGGNVMRQVHPGIDYRSLTQSLQQGNMYLVPQVNQQQQQQQEQQATLLASPTKLDPQSPDLSRTNGVLTAGEYQLIARSLAATESSTRTPVLMTNSDPRQTPHPQTFQTLIGYMETLKFLENLPTNTAPNAIQVQQIQNLVNAQNVLNVQSLPTIEVSQGQQTHIIPVSYASNTSVNQNVISLNQSDLKNMVGLSHSPNQQDLKTLIANQGDLKNIVAFSHNPATPDLKNITLSQPTNQLDLKTLIALSQNQNTLQNVPQEMKGMVVADSPVQNIAYQH